MNIRKYTDQERYQRQLEASRRYYKKKKDDQEFKEKHRKQSKRYREKDQEWYRQYQREKQRKYAEEHKEKILEKARVYSRERYQKIKSDPELLKKYKESVKRSIKKRIENDPDYKNVLRDRKMAYNRAYNRKRMAARSYDFLKKSIRVSRYGFEEAKRILARKDLNVTVSYAGENVLVISFAQNDNVYRTINLSIPEEK